MQFFVVLLMVGPCLVSNPLFVSLFTADGAGEAALFCCLGEVDTQKPDQLHPAGPLRSGDVLR